MIKLYFTCHINNNGYHVLNVNQVPHDKGATIKLILHITYIGSEKLSSYPSLCYGKVSKVRILMSVCLTPSTMP